MRVILLQILLCLVAIGFPVAARGIQPCEYNSCRIVEFKNGQIKQFLSSEVIPYMVENDFSKDKYYIICDFGEVKNLCEYCIITTIPKSFFSPTDLMSLWNFYTVFATDGTITDDNMGYCSMDGYGIIVNGDSQIAKRFVSVLDETKDIPVYDCVRDYNADANWDLKIKGKKILSQRFRPPISKYDYLPDVD